MRILVNQTTRMGDMIQTSPLIRELREKYPHARITAMVRRMGRVIAEHHPDIDDVIIYDEDELYLDLTSNDSERLLRAYELTETRVRMLRECRFDLAFNVTHSIASAMLLKLAEIPTVVGAHLSDDWQFLLRGNWPAYFFTSVYSREYNDLNLCDITRNFVAGVACKQLVFAVKEEERAFAEALFLEHGIQGGDFVACMQLGASEENKRWPEGRFAELARLLGEKYQAKIFLLGVKEEARLGERFLHVLEEHSKDGRDNRIEVIPLYGRTTVPQVAAVLERASILITNDTGTMHIAAAVHCPIALVSVGHVHYRETGPYGEGHVAVECRRQYLGRSDFVPGGLDEREQIQAEHVLAAVELALRQGGPPHPLPSQGQAHPLPRKAGGEGTGGTGLGPIPEVARMEGGEGEILRKLRMTDAGTEAGPRMEETAELAEVDLYVTRFAPDDCLQFYPVICRPMTERDFVRMAYRAMWLQHLREQHDAQAERESLERVLSCYSGPGVEKVRTWAVSIAEAFATLAEYAQEGVEITGQLLHILRSGQRMARAKSVVSELMQVDERCRLHGDLHPPCKPLVLMARFERDNLEGADPLFLAETTLHIYEACLERAGLMAKKLRLVEEVWGRRSAGIEQIN